MQPIAPSALFLGALEQGEIPIPSTSATTLGSGLPDPNTSKLPRAVEDASIIEADDESVPCQGHGLYRSRQAPRKVRLERERLEQQELDKQQQQEKVIENALNEDGGLHSNLKDIDPAEKLHHSLCEPDAQTSIFHPDPVHLPQLLKISQPSFFNPFPLSLPRQGASSLATLAASPHSKPPLQVVCYARTRVPTPHGEVFLHIYKNNWDDKEHLAFVFDRDQLEETSSRSGADIDENGRVNRDQAYGTLRSKSLDSVWRKGETDVERIVRGAYVGRLSPTSAEVSRPAPVSSTSASSLSSDEDKNNDAVLVRIHSECFTGETIGSQRCDCGEQLDEAFRLIGTSASGLGIIIYLRQEGRGIGLLEKIKAYNLQDLGHDTVTANLLLGHGADQRDYALAGEMLRDLGVGNTHDNNNNDKIGDGSGTGRNVRLLTNNPDKIDSIEKEGIKVEERVPMVPRGWTVQMPHLTLQKKSGSKQKRKKSSASKDNTTSNHHTKSKPRRPKLNLGDSVASIRSTAFESPMLSPALSSSTTSIPKLKNKKIEALKPLSSSFYADGIRSMEASASEAETEDIDNDDDDVADSYGMPSAFGSADERDSLEETAAGQMERDGEASTSDDEDEEEDEEEEDSDDSAEREEALEDYLISMNRTGVGMIGAGVTHSKELEKYLKTKIERMGHMLVAPATPPSTPLPLQRGSRIRSQHQHSKKSHSTTTTSKLKHEDREDAATNADTTKLSKINGGNGTPAPEECEDCREDEEERLRRIRRGYFDTEIHSEDMFD